MAARRATVPDATTADLVPNHRVIQKALRCDTDTCGSVTDTRASVAACAEGHGQRHALRLETNSEEAFSDLGLARGPLAGLSGRGLAGYFRELDNRLSMSRSLADNRSG